MNVLRTALYIRVSTEEQVLHGLSLEAQQAALERFASEHEYKVIGTYIDGGKTARKSLKNRTELLRLLSDVKADKVDLIIFTKLDRWFRNIKDYYKVQEVLEKHNCNWKTVFENYDTTTANGRLHINIMLSIAQDEADRTSERIKAVFANKRAHGEIISGNMPVGYRLENKKVYIDEGKKDIVVDLFNNYILLQSFHKVAELIENIHGYKADASQVKRMLSNPSYVGQRSGFEDCPIIDKNTFNEVQEILAKHNVKHTPTGLEYIFTGLIICAECGKPMIGYPSTNGNRKGYNSRYRCDYHWRRFSCIHNRSLSEKKIEIHLLEVIHDTVQAAVFQADIKVPPRKKKKVNKDKINSKLERLKNLYLNEMIEFDEYKATREILLQQLQEDEEPEPESNLDTLKEFLKSDFETVYKTLDKPAKRVFWRNLIDTIIIDNDNNITINCKV